MKNAPSQEFLNEVGVTDNFVKTAGVGDGPNGKVKEGQEMERIGVVDFCGWILMLAPFLLRFISEIHHDLLKESTVYKRQELVFVYFLQFFCWVILQEMISGMSQG